MGTKLEYAINPLANSPKINSFTLHRVDDRDSFQKTVLKENYQEIVGLDRFQNSMDRRLERHNMEAIRKTMQMHEDIFKHQVRELHRLYTVQKMLTEELKKEIKQSRYWTPVAAPSSGANHAEFVSRHHLTSQATSGYNFQVQGLKDEPSSRERSGSCSGDTMKIHARGFDLERPADEEISTEVSAIEDQAGPSSLMFVPRRSNQMSIDGSDEDSEVELTLSIGGSSSSKKRQETYKLHHKAAIRELDSSASFKSDRGEDCSGPNTPMSSSSATFDQDGKRPHWLFQGLSISRT